MGYGLYFLSINYHSAFLAYKPSMPYLDPIFQTEDVDRQLPREPKGNMNSVTGSISD